MTMVRRTLIILLGYVCAAIVGGIVLLLIACAAGASPSGWPGPVEFAKTAGLIAFIAATIGAPVIIPVIVCIELNPKIGLTACLLGGLLLGLFTGTLLNWNGFQPGPLVAAVIASTSGAMTYWLIACFALPRIRTEPGNDRIIQSRTI